MSIYDHTGPHHVEAIPDGESMHSGRPTYRVVCHTCRGVVHGGTNAPHIRIRDHLAGAYDARPEGYAALPDDGSPTRERTP